MKIQIEVHWPRALRGRGRLVAMGALVALLAIAVPSALAAHDFTDVPNAHPFHTDIGAMKDTGITAGKTCEPPGTPPTYCPSENITREAMAAFMRRGIGRVDMDTTADATDLPISGTAFTNLLTETMTVGGVAGNQYVKVDGWFTVDNDDAFTSDCEIEMRFIFDEGQADQIIGLSSFGELAVTDGSNDQTFTNSFAFPAVSGNHSFTLEARWFGGTCNDTDNLIEIHEAAVIVQTFPLNSGGTSAPGPLGAEPGEPTQQQPLANPPTEAGS